MTSRDPSLRANRRSALVAALCVLVSFHHAAAQDTPPNPHQPPASSSPVSIFAPSAAPSATNERRTIARADLARAYIDFERAVAKVRPGGEQWIHASDVIDEATSDFFSGKAARAVRRLIEGAATIRHEPDTPELRAARTLNAWIDPPVWTYYSRPAPVLHARSLWNPAAGLNEHDNKGASMEPFTVTIEPAGGHAGASGGFGGGATLSLAAPAPGEFHADIDLSGFVTSLVPNHYHVSVHSGGWTRELCEWDVVGAPRAAVRARLENDVADAVSRLPSSDQVRQAVAIFHARCALMSDTPSRALSSGFLTNQFSIEDELIHERDALLAGVDPYADRPGETYRVFSSSSVRSDAEPVPAIPVRVYAPAEVKSLGVLPLVVTLHGAGEDEAMFMDGYAAGGIKRLADEKHFIVAAPLAYAMTLNPALFDDLVKSVALDYHVDPRRVYVLGHSMGALAASSLAQQRASRIAAAVCISGAVAFESPRCAPTLIFISGRDMIFSSSRLQSLARAALEAGKPVQQRVLNDCGHGLSVAATLPEAVDWLLSHTSAAPAVDAR